MPNISDDTIERVRSAVDIQSALDAVIQATNAARTRLKELHRDRDYPHTNQKYAQDALARIEAMKKELTAAEESYGKLLLRLSPDYLDREIYQTIDIIEKHDAAREQLKADLAETQARESKERNLQPHIDRFDKVLEMLKELPEAERNAVVARLREGVL